MVIKKVKEVEVMMLMKVGDNISSHFFRLSFFKKENEEADEKRKNNNRLVVVKKEKAV